MAGSRHGQGTVSPFRLRMVTPTIDLEHGIEPGT